MKAAIFRALEQPLTIEDVEIDQPGPREVLIRTVASGVCHSDLHVLHGTLPTKTPAILGHEPAGIVEAVGTEVATVKPGDHARRLHLDLLRQLHPMPPRPSSSMRRARRLPAPP